MIDPNIILGIKPSPNAAEVMAGGMKLQQMQREGQLGDLQLQQAKQDWTDQQAARQILSQYPNPEQALPALAGKISPKAFFDFQSKIIDNHKKIADTAKSQADASKAEADASKIETDFFGNLARGSQKDNYSPSSFMAALDTVTKAYPSYRSHALQIAQSVQQNPDSIKNIIDSLVNASQQAQQLGLNEQNVASEGKLRQAQTEEAQQKAVGAGVDLAARTVPDVTDQASYENWLRQQKPEVAAKMPTRFGPGTLEQIRKMAVPAKDQPEYDIKKLQADAMRRFQENPAQGLSQIDAIIPASLDPRANQTYKSAFSYAMQNGGPEAAKSIVAAAAAHAASIEQATNPAIKQAEVNRAVAVEAATAPIQVQKEIAKQKAIAAMSPDAFAGVTDARSRVQAQSNYEKDSKEYADKVGSARQLTDFVQAAQSGNKAAPGLIPVTEVRSIVNRVNRQELEAVSSSAGSALDRVQGFFGKWTEGQPIPPAILADTAKIAQLNEQAARRTYDFKVRVTNQTYGSKAQPIDLPSTPGSSAAPAKPQYKPGDTVMYQGKPHKIQAIKADGKLVLEQ